MTELSVFTLSGLELGVEGVVGLTFDLKDVDVELELSALLSVTTLGGLEGRKEGRKEQGMSEVRTEAGKEGRGRGGT
jgi:hypothetical protein